MSSIAQILLILLVLLPFLLPPPPFLLLHLFFRCCHGHPHGPDFEQEEALAHQAKRGGNAADAPCSVAFAAFAGCIAACGTARLPAELVLSRINAGSAGVAQTALALARFLLPLYRSIFVSKLLVTGRGVGKEKDCKQGGLLRGELVEAQAEGDQDRFRRTRNRALLQEMG